MGILLLASLAAAAQTPRDDAAAWERSTLRIGVPASDIVGVSVAIGDGAITLNLPPSATYPADFIAETGGMLRGGRLTRLDDERIRIELTLAGGFLEGVSIEGDGLALSFRRRGTSAAARAGADSDGLYRLGADDKILIAVTGHPELTQQVVVGPTGTVTAPLVGEVGAAGLTVSELTSRVTELLARDYMVDPHVDVQVVEYRSQWAVVGGEVRSPVRVPLKGTTDLKEALAEAGGFGPEAGEEIEISRKGPGGAMTTTRIDRTAFERGEDVPRLLPGDLVSVPRAAYAYVNGEVRVPGRVRIERGMTLLRLLSVQGGLTEWANRKEIRIRRDGDDGAGERFNLKDVDSGRVADPEIRGGDIVTVPRRFL